MPILIQEVTSRRGSIFLVDGASRGVCRGTEGEVHSACTSNRLVGCCCFSLFAQTHFRLRRFRGSCSGHQNKAYSDTLCWKLLLRLTALFVTQHVFRVSIY